MNQGRSFLIVDNSPVMRRAIRRVVKEFASKIIECDDGAKAFSAYREHLPDWVLMEVEMNGKDGLEATREICASDADARIIIVTKFTTPETREGARLAGAFAFVAKENLLELREIITN